MSIKKTLAAAITLAAFGGGLLLAADSTIQGAQDTRLVILASQGDRPGVSALLKQKVDVNVAQGDGMTALHWAALKDDVQMAKMLLDAGADVKAVTRVEALTPLWLAAHEGHAAMVELLLKSGSDSNSANNLGTTALMTASASGSADAVKALLDHGANVNAKETSHGQTALMFAASVDRDEVIRLLASHGADMNVTSTVTKLGKVLFDADGNPLPSAGRGGAGRGGQQAAGGRQQAPGGAGAQFMGGWTALHFASRDGLVNAAKALVESGANINEPGAGDKTSPLVIAIANGHFDLAKYLIDKGADVNASSTDGLSPVYAAIDTQWAPVAWAPVPDTSKEKTSYLDLMKLLVDHHADLNVKLTRGLWFRPADHNQSWIRNPGQNAFIRAAQATDLDAMKFLADHGADVKAVTAQKDNALMVAAGVGWAGNFSTNAPGPFLPAVKYLVETAGLDINAVDSQGFTAVMGAAYRGDNEMVQYLVDHGAKLDFRTSRGWSVTDMANGPSLRTSVPVSHPETIALLTKLGAPPLLKVEGEEILGIIKGKAPVLKNQDDAAKPDAKPEPKRQ